MEDMNQIAKRAVDEGARARLVLATLDKPEGGEDG